MDYYEIIKSIFKYKTNFPYFIQYGAIILSSLFLFALLKIITIILKRSTIIFKHHEIEISILVCTFATIGFSVGIISGMSRIPVIDVVVSSVLTFLSGVILFFLNKTSKNKTIASAVSIIVFSIMLVYGINFGSINRVKSENAQRYYDDVVKKQIESLIKLQEYDKLKELDNYYAIETFNSE